MTEDNPQDAFTQVGTSFPTDSRTKVVKSGFKLWVLFS